MKRYIVFTKVKSESVLYIYPNLVEAHNWESAVGHVLEIRDKHEAIAVSSEGYVFTDQSSVDFQMFDAVKQVIQEEFKLGDFVQAKR